jgi:hypothetical protein
MPASLADLLHNWQNFYILTGTASATLVGLMFVAASIGSSVFGETHRSALRAFLTPTVVHFAVVLMVSVLVMVPTNSYGSLGILLTLAGLGGSSYSGLILVQIIIQKRFKVDMLDRLFYALVPAAGYLMLLAAAYLMLIAVPAATTLLAAALLTLLVVGLRNAWDMTVWTAIRAPSASAEPATSPGTAETADPKTTAMQTATEPDAPDQKTAIVQTATEP